MITCVNETIVIYDIGLLGLLDPCDRIPRSPHLPPEEFLHRQRVHPMLANATAFQSGKSIQKLQKIVEVIRQDA
jgi:hypothetical protein